MENIRTVHDSLGSRIGDATLSGIGFLAKNTGKLAWQTGKTIGKLSLGTAGILGQGTIGLASGLGRLSINLGYYGGKNWFYCLMRVLKCLRNIEIIRKKQGRAVDYEHFK